MNEKYLSGICPVSMKKKGISEYLSWIYLVSMKTGISEYLSGIYSVSTKKGYFRISLWDLLRFNERRLFQNVPLGSTQFQ